MISGIAFIVVALGFCGLAVMAIFGVTELRMSGSDAVERDGLARGVPVPRWTLADSSGQLRTSPPTKAFQLVMFTDHSLKSFPSIIEALQALEDEEALEIVILLDRQNELAPPVLRMLGLARIPVVAGSRSLYGAYNVRVTPWAMFVNSSGRACASSLINHGWQVAKLWELSQVPFADEELQRGRRSARFRIGVARG